MSLFCFDIGQKSVIFVPVFKSLKRKRIQKGLVESARHLYFRIYPFANIASLFLLSNNSYKNLKAARLRGSFREIKGLTKTLIKARSE